MTADSPSQARSRSDGVRPPRGNLRIEQRHEVTVSGRYRSRTGAAKDIWIKDISESGCRFDDRFCILTQGTTITFRVGQIGPITAIVRWRERDVVGVEFTQALHPSVLDHIVATMDRP